MKNLAIRLLAAVPAVALSAVAASAQSYTYGNWYWWGGSWNWGSGGHTSSSVPEIDASTGALAIAAVSAAVLLTREIKRRRKD